MDGSVFYVICWYFIVTVIFASQIDMHHSHCLRSLSFDLVTGLKFSKDFGTP